MDKAVRMFLPDEQSSLYARFPRDGSKVGRNPSKPLLSLVDLLLRLEQVGIVLEEGLDFILHAQYF